MVRRSRLWLLREALVSNKTFIFRGGRVIHTRNAMDALHEIKEEQEEAREEVVSNCDFVQKKRMQNLLSAVILLGGLFIGSLFVDIAQLTRGEGFSPRSIREHNILEAAGKTWVAYPDPKVNVEVVTDSSCETCAPDEALVWFRRILPTMDAIPVEASSPRGEELIERFDIATIPAFVFAEEVAMTDFYLLASEIFEEQEGGYLLDTAQLGIAPGKYLSLPEIDEDDIVIGSRDAAVTVVTYSDFQCPYSRAFHENAVKPMFDEFGDRVAFVFKHLPLSFHLQARSAALAAECANAQGGFVEYADMLFTRQSEWGATEDTQLFKSYAGRLGLDRTRFDACLNEERYADKVDADMDEAASLGVDGTPGTFVGDTFLSGAQPYEALRELIEGLEGEEDAEVVE